MSKYDDVVSSNFVLYMLTFPDIFRRNSKKAPCIMWEHLTSSIFAAASREAVGLATFLPAPASKVWRAPGSNTARSGKENRVHVERVLNFEVFVCKMCLRKKELSVETCVCQWRRTCWVRSSSNKAGPTNETDSQVVDDVSVQVWHYLEHIRGLTLTKLISTFDCNALSQKSKENHDAFGDNPPLRQIAEAWRQAA